ncbi:MAG: RagB/SusD family nutrient uptake outer membrane protein [Gemmatimonadaceae bacterium]|nr:RagB/SusD family nutrient uptake outer membrane protein [Gemmatimonadaceae bacterium]MDQ3518594.1 RagB/SusD family nutrient uptake outer membrane protein [Gemmatimonadota bacterium]
MNPYNGIKRSILRTRRLRGAVTAVATTAVLSVAGCDILEVSNPNNVSEEALVNPAAAAPLVNGLVASTTRAIAAILTSYSTASDELIWVGSRDAYNQLDLGGVGDPSNEFVDASFFYVAEARYLANNAIDRLVAFGFEEADAGDDDKLLLARAYLYSAVIYTTIADQFDDFAFSNKTIPGENIGPANMVQLYDSAIAYLTRAEPLAAATGDTDLEGTILAMRARARHARAVWELLNPSGTTPSNPLVNDAGANADAQAALALLSGDFEFTLKLAPPLSDGAVAIGFNVNSRLEVTFSDRLVNLDGTGKKPTATNPVKLRDPITNAPDPVLLAFIQEFVAARDFPELTVVSQREMYLILAEAALAQGNTAGFTTQINLLRALDALTPYSGQVAARTLLIHERDVNLYLQGRRLNDLYRFGIKDPRWNPSDDASTCPGIFFAITVTERQSNPLADESPTGCNQ